MNISKAIMVFLSILCISCAKKEPPKTMFCGKITNPVGDKVVLYFNNQVIDSTIIDTQNRFSFVFDEFSENGLYYFKTSNQFQYVYLEKNDSLFVSLNTYNFHKSIFFSGKGSEINNFLNEIEQQAQNQEHIYDNWFKETPKEFSQKVDSVYQNYVIAYDNFLQRNPKLSKQAMKMAQASFFFVAHKPYELYHLRYQREQGKEIVLSDKFYDYRKDIDFNDAQLCFFNPYHQYLVQYINNISYQKTIKNTKNISDKNDRLLSFQLNKLKTIDSIFGDNMIKDNMLRNASFSYLLNSKEETYNQKYIEQLKLYLEDKSHQKEIKKLYEAVLKFEKGKSIPSYPVKGIDGKEVDLKSIVRKGRLNVFYFWSTNYEHAQYVHFRIEQLKEIFPKANFVGIEIGTNYDKWLYAVSDTKLISSKQYYIKEYKQEVDKELIAFNMNKALITDKLGNIAETFADIFSPKIEEVLILHN